MKEARAAPQQGMPEGVTSCAHRAASSSNAPLTPIFFDEQGMWMATLSRTLRHSSLSLRKRLINWAGSYKENLSPLWRSHVTSSAKLGLGANGMIMLHAGIRHTTGHR